MKITGTINLDVRDISTTYEYGRLILNANNKQVGVQITYEGAELLQAELMKVLPNTNISQCYKNYCEQFMGEHKPDGNSQKLSFDEWFTEYVNVHSLFNEVTEKDLDKQAYLEYYKEGKSPSQAFKEEAILSQ